MRDESRRLKQSVEREAERIAQAERDKGSLLALTGYLGSLAILFLLPVIAGAYLGNWLDGRAAGFSSKWTVSFIFAGVLVGAINVYLFIRERN